jgi:hypothetical protein
MFSMATAFQLHAGLQTRFRTSDTGFICASAFRFYIGRYRREFHFPSIFNELKSMGDAVQQCAMDRRPYSFPDP